MKCLEIRWVKQIFLRFKIYCMYKQQSNYQVNYEKNHIFSHRFFSNRPVRILYILYFLQWKLKIGGRRVSTLPMASNLNIFSPSLIPQGKCLNPLCSPCNPLGPKTDTLSHKPDGSGTMSLWRTHIHIRKYNLIRTDTLKHTYISCAYTTI